MASPGLRWPAPLKPGDSFFITAPSSGVPAPLHPRLDLALERLRQQGYRVVEGQCLRQDRHAVSATAAERASEWQGALLNPEYQAVMAPWGGERAIELLPLIDFEALGRAEPKWVTGFSDLSTLALPLCLLGGWVSVHGPNLMELASQPLDSMTGGLLQALPQPQPAQWAQATSSAHRSSAWADWALEPAAPLSLDMPTRWRLLREDMPRRASGRLIGGCLETVSRIAGTRYAPMRQFEGPRLLYLECCEASPHEVARSLHSLALHGWFEDLAALLIGRSSAAIAQTADGFSGWSVLEDLLPDFQGPVVLDMDIGHVPPQLTLANGAWGELCVEAGAERLIQQWGAR